MKNTVSSSVLISAPLSEVWSYISDFSDASHQVIAVENTKMMGNDQRIVSFKNGHQVAEQLVEKSQNTKLRWKQENRKGFVPLKNTEGELSIAPNGKDTKLTFAFHYNTLMGPIGWMMNMMMVKSKLTGIAKSNARKIQKHFIA